MDDLLKKTRNIYAIARNYVAHVRELGNQIPEEPVIFSKCLSALTSDTHLEFPSILKPLHYEGELVLRLGQTIPLNSFSNLACVSHIGLGIDFTARGLQNALKGKGLPWHLSKSFVNAGFVGGLKEGVDLERPLHFQLSLNGEVKQMGDTQKVMYPFAKILAFLNQFVALEEGDLVYTGTPAGVAALESGDRIQIASEDLDASIEVTVDFLE